MKSNKNNFHKYINTLQQIAFLLNIKESPETSSDFLKEIRTSPILDGRKNQTGLY